MLAEATKLLLHYARTHELGHLVHGWANIENLNVYSLLGLSTLKNVKWYQL